MYEGSIEPPLNHAFVGQRLQTRQILLRIDDPVPPVHVLSFRLVDLHVSECRLTEEPPLELAPLITQSLMATLC
jgi:hypothetical protein